MSEQLLKKAKKKRTRTIGIIVVIVVLVILGCAGLAAHKSGGHAGTVTISIDCSDLSSQMEKLRREEIREYIPKDGVILAPTEYDFSEGETVYDCLYNVCREKKIQMESSEDNVYKSRYVEGIGHLYEMDAGKRSGWTYYVNDEMPDYGCSKVKLEDGQKIRWVYVVDYAKSGGASDSKTDAGGNDGADKDAGSRD